MGRCIRAIRDFSYAVVIVCWLIAAFAAEEFGDALRRMRQRAALWGVSPDEESRLLRIVHLGFRLREARESFFVSSHMMRAEIAEELARSRAESVGMGVAPWRIRLIES